MAKAQKAERLAALPLGGIGRIGMNCMVYECDGDHILVDCGVSFPSEAQPGVDLVLPDTTYVREHAKKFKGIFITHAHEDHIGAMGYLWDELNVPVYVSPFAKRVLEDKLAQVGFKPGKRIVEIQPRQSYEAGKFAVEFVQMTHSIPEAFALAITTPHGTIVHTGDYKFDADPVIGPPVDEARLREIGDAGVLAMFGDSTGIFTDQAGSEGALVPKLEKLFKSIDGRIFVTTFASNAGRVLKMLEICSRIDRKLCLLGRTAQKMVQHTKELGYFPGSLTNHMCSVEEAAGLPAHKVMIFASGTQGEPNSSLTRLSKGDNIKGVRIKPSDTVVMSSKMIPGNERGILDVVNGLIDLGARVITEHLDDVHVSGHGGREEMRKMYDLLRPQVLVPVHGESAHLHAQADWAKACGVPHAVIPRVGRKLVLAPGAVHEMNNSFPYGENYVDGLNILDADAWIIQERRKLAYDGVVFVAVPVAEQSGQLAGDALVTSRGLVDPTLQPDFHPALQDKIQRTLEAVFGNGQMADATRLGEAVQQTVRKFSQQERGKKPVVVVEVLLV